MLMSDTERKYEYSGNQMQLLEILIHAEVCYSTLGERNKFLLKQQMRFPPFPSNI